ncbi:aspartate/glutamate racemase family protein [Chloroflexota bacterium]
MRIKIIRPNSRYAVPPEYVEITNKKIRSYASPGTELVIVFPDAPKTVGGYGGPLSEARTQGIVPYVIKEVISAEEEGFDGVLMMGEYNVGAEIAKHMVKLPIIDSGMAIVHVAAMVGDRLCVIVPEETVKAYVRRLFRRWGMEHFIASMKAWGCSAHEVWQDQKLKEGLKDRTIQICKEAIEKDDAQVILPYCGPFVPAIVSPKDIEAAVGVPVINTTAVTVKMAEIFVSLDIRPSRMVYPFVAFE